MTPVQVGIVMGSKSDRETMDKAAQVLKDFGVSYVMMVASAHRTPARVVRIAQRAEEEGWKALIAGAGMAAHLAGFLAAHTVIPVIGVPMDSSSLNGIDALLSTVQMPGGIPVACMGIGAAGAKNAALFAVEVLASHDPVLKEKLRSYRRELAREIEESSI
jgi:phosphoribosylaminoimidazole carboxylase PurE protein|uniref:N5-carboxyaminoimidazole ribonucleotide mutase n=1 Tax=Desulfomonile tiedjei TaxID=2358 RepID=A0A7C4EVE5_9BACT